MTRTFTRAYSAGWRDAVFVAGRVNPYTAAPDRAHWDEGYDDRQIQEERFADQERWST